MNNDGYENIFTGLGTRLDPTTATRFSAELLLAQEQLEAIFRSDGIGRRIVVRPAEDMFREWFAIDFKGKSDKPQAFLDKLEVMRAKQRFAEGVTLARLYGGALVVAVTAEGVGALERPWREGEEVVGLRVYDRHQVTFDVNTVSSDPLRALDGLPEFYEVSLYSRPIKDPGTGRLRIHETRAHLIQGQFVPERVRQSQNGWGDPVLQAAWSALRRFGATQGYTENIIKEFSQSVLSVKGLTNLIVGGREEVVQRRLTLLDMSKSVLNTMIIDADGEEYSRSSSSVAGLAEIMDRMAEQLSASVNFPITVLMGRSPAGMNATGKSDEAIYNNFIASEQERVASPMAEWLLGLMIGQATAWSVVWTPLNQPTSKEILEERKLVADTDKVYLDAGVVSAEEVAESRFGSGTWDRETKLIEGTDRAEEPVGIEDPATDAPGLNEDWVNQPRAVKGTAQGGQWVPNNGGWGKSGASYQVTPIKAPGGDFKTSSDVGKLKENRNNGYMEIEDLDSDATVIHSQRPDFVSPDDNINLYLSSAYAEINTSLRKTGKFPNKDQIDEKWGAEFDSKFSPSLKDEEVYRASFAADSQITPGKKFSDKGYTSTSTLAVVPYNALDENSDVAPRGTSPTIYKIKVPKGTPTLVTNSDQQEVILGRGTEYVVTSKFKQFVRYSNNGTNLGSLYLNVVEMEVVKKG